MSADQAKHSIKEWLSGALLISAITLAPLGTSHAKDILIFAASSLALPLQEIGDSYNINGSDTVRISFASSSTLARQISKGAPADIFISANQKWMNHLSQRNSIVLNSQRALLSNRLVMISPTGSAYLSKSSSINTILNEGRLAIGDPDHVPVGIYGMQALKSLKMWRVAKDRLARLTNARTVLAFVERGETPAGIVYHSDAHANKKIDVVFTFPSNSHDPISYWAARTRQENAPAAQRFFIILFSPASKDVFKRHGFLVN
jgi:molybdate transport system substrate-binding protein